MTEPLIPAEGFEALGAAREIAHGRRERRRRTARVVGLALRWMFGAGPVWSGWLFWAWSLAQRPLDGWRIVTLAVVSVYAVCLTLSLVLQGHGDRHGRRIGSFAVGLACGWIASLVPLVVSSSRHMLEAALQVPVLLVIALVQDPLRALAAAGSSLWTLGPLSVSLVSAWDAVSAVRRRRGSRFDGRDAIWILLGLLLGFASTIAWHFWPSWPRSGSGGS